MSSQYGELRTLTAEIGLSVWGTTANFNRFRVLASLLQRRRSPDANQTLHDLLPFPGLVVVHYTFWGFCPLMEFCYVQNSLCVLVLRSPILAALRLGTPAAGLSQTLRRGTRNGITELSLRAPPVFVWAAITLGIGPHSSLYKIYSQHFVSGILLLEKLYHVAKQVLLPFYDDTLFIGLP